MVFCFVQLPEAVAPGYVNHSFWAGTSAIRKVEKPDPYFDGVVTTKTTLSVFLEQYEAVMRLPLQKAQTLDSIADVINGQIDARHHDTAIAQCEQCYEIVMNALRSLKGVGQSGTQRADKSSGSNTTLDPTSRSKYTNQIIPLSVQWPDTALHEQLYRTLSEFGLENELLGYGGSDLVAFLQSAVRKHQEEVRGVSADASRGSKLHNLGAPISTIQTKYIELLAKYDVFKGEHIAAARLLLILAERQCSNAKEAPTLDTKYQYLSNVVLQAKSTADTEAAKTAKDEAKELPLKLKSIAHLYSDYAITFNLWEVCLERLNFAKYSGDADSKVVREIRARLLDPALTRGGVAEACSVMKRVGLKLDHADGACLPMDIICLHLAKAALDRLSTGEELVGDEDVARVLLRHDKLVTQCLIRWVNLTPEEAFWKDADFFS